MSTDATTGEVRIEAFQEAQLAPLKVLFASYFPVGDRLLTDAYSRWLYAGSPFGCALMVRVAAAGQWLGFMAMVPVDLVKGSERLRAYYVVNVLVHPEHHGKNLFGQMITAAKERVAAEGAALMGHPNDLALKSWQRSGMHFHEPLRPRLGLSLGLGSGVRCTAVRTREAVERVVPALRVLTDRSDRWSVAVSGDFLEWRFLRHPTNHYRVQRVEVGGAPVGLQVCKRSRPGLWLLADQLVPDALVPAATAGLPLVTLGLRSDTAVRELPGRVWTPPVKKQLPFFCTRPGAPLVTAELATLGLSASDF